MHKQQGELKQIQQYIFDKSQQLGQGSYGTVYLGHSASNPSASFAVKVVPVSLIQGDPELQENLFSEMKVMTLLNHENIVRCFDIIPTANNYYFMMENCDGGTLGQHLKACGRLPEPEALSILVQILKGYYEMLKLGIIHRDIKPENILIRDGVFKLADFGFAKCLENFKKDVLKSLVGTPLYMSPQILQGREYNTKTDLWSIAIIYYEMLCGGTPWTAKSHIELLNKMLRQPVVFPKDVAISAESRDFISGALRIDEAKRFSWEEVFCHPLFRDAFGYRARKKELHQQARNYQSTLKELIIGYDLYKLFQEIDKNGNNQLEINEFACLIRTLDRQASREQIEFVFNSIDEDGNNVISLYEFRKWLYASGGNAGGPAKFQKQKSLPFQLPESKPAYSEYPGKGYHPSPVQALPPQILRLDNPYSVGRTSAQIIAGPQICMDSRCSLTQMPGYGPPLLPPKPMNAPANPNLPLRFPGPVFAQPPPPAAYNIYPQFGFR